MFFSLMLDNKTHKLNMDDEDGSEHDCHAFDRQRFGVHASVEEDSELDATIVADGEAHERANDEQGRELLIKQWGRALRQTSLLPVQGSSLYFRKPKNTQFFVTTRKSN